MAVIVQKYGGSSVADIEKLRSVADKVVAARKAGNDVVVTISAMGKTTDNLLNQAKEAASIEGRPGAPSRRELDMLVSTGERVSMALLAIAIEARGEKAISFTGSQSGLITNDRHFDARIIEVRPHRIEDELARGKVVIVAGYQGMSYKREITTLGRGGSDTTAVALAAALGAERCEIYSDVDGVYSADPRVVPEAQHLHELAPEMLQEMAEAGAKVLNAQAVEWARKAKIAIHARSTQDRWEQGNSHRQTLIHELPPGAARARAVVAENNLVLGHLHGEDASSLERLIQFATEHEIPLKDISFSKNSTLFSIPLLNMPDWPRARSILLESFSPLSLQENICAISVVGDGLSTTGRPLLDFLSTLRTHELPFYAIHSTALRMTALLDPAASIRAQQSFHSQFCQ